MGNLLNWIPRDDEPKDHSLIGLEHFGTQPPCTMYEERPLLDPAGYEVQGLKVAWVILNNPKQYNSYTTDMVKGVTAGFQRASSNPAVVAVVFTGVGNFAFCTGGNTKEYAEHYARRPEEYRGYMELFNGMVDAILGCRKPTICRINGMRIAGGQEIGMACDLSISVDTALIGQAGPRHGSAPDGGSTDFLPWLLPLEAAMWNCVSCDPWSAYKMYRLNLIQDVVRVVKKDGEFVANPAVITDRYVEDGKIVYGEFVGGQAGKDARAFLKTAEYDHELLDNAVARIVWTFANLFPGCLMKSIYGIRQKKRSSWDANKFNHLHWLGDNMSVEAFLGFTAFNTKKITGRDTIDFIKFRQLIADGAIMDEETFAQVLPEPVES